MSDILWLLAEHFPGWLLFFAMAICVLVGGFAALLIGSVRWWWVKKTRMPGLWTRERAQYLAQIGRLKREAAVKDEESNRLKTAAYGTVVMEFRSAVLTTGGKNG